MPPFGGNTQDDFQPAFGRWIGSYILYFPVQRWFGNRTFLDINHEPIVGANKANIQPLLKFVPLAPDHDPISVTVRLWTGEYWCDH